jgi:outer membrane receptor protein involved in Fe transport
VESTGSTTAGRPLLGKNKYTDWLPSLNLVYEPVKDLLVRFGASRVMARPLLGNLSPSITAMSIPNSTDTSAIGSLTVGNPKLKPFYATNTDASVEWYFRPGSLVSLALFNKKIHSFPQTILFSAPLSRFLDPENIDALKQQFTNANQLAYIDQDLEFTARQFRDAPGGYLRGIEVSYQQDFTFLPGFLKNFGALLNYTYIKSELNYILDPGTATIAQTTGKAPFLNVSPQFILKRGFERGRAERFLADLGIAPDRVVIELTEDHPTFDLPVVHDSLMLYRSMGFRIAIDDLGEGFASLRLWSELRPEFVKADKHFVTGVANDPVKAQFLRAIQDIA